MSKKSKQRHKVSGVKSYGLKTPDFRKSIPRTTSNPQALDLSRARPQRPLSLFDVVGDAMARAGNVAPRAKPNYGALITPIPTQHGFTPSTVTKKAPQKKQPVTKLTEPAPQSPKARDEKKQCKARPEGHNKRRAGGGASKRYVPWC